MPAKTPRLPNQLRKPCEIKHLSAGVSQTEQMFYSKYIENTFRVKVYAAISPQNSPFFRFYFKAIAYDLLSSPRVNRLQ